MSEIKVLTFDLLKSWNACSNGLNLFKNGKLEGFPVDRLNELKGDFNGFVAWIKEQLKSERKYDENGNCIWKKYPDGRIYEYGYDELGNEIWKKNPNGNIIEYKHDIEFYDDGQLKRIDDLEIPLFEK